MGHADGDDARATCMWVALSLLLLLLSSAIVTHCVARAQDRTDPAATFYYQPYRPAARVFEEMYDGPDDRRRRPGRPSAAPAVTFVTESVATPDGRVRLSSRRRGTDATQQVQAS
jgi:hypothetical protein